MLVLRVVALLLGATLLASGVAMVAIAFSNYGFSAGITRAFFQALCNVTGGTADASRAVFQVDTRWGQGAGVLSVLDAQNAASPAANVSMQLYLHIPMQDAPCILPLLNQAPSSRSNLLPYPSLGVAGFSRGSLYDPQFAIINATFADYEEDRTLLGVLSVVGVLVALAGLVVLLATSIKWYMLLKEENV